MPGWFPYSRLREALLAQLRPAWIKDINASVRAVQKDLSRVQSELAELRREHDALIVKEWTASRAPLGSRIDATLCLPRIREHILSAVARAAVSTEPTTHAVIENVLPADFYQLVDSAIPPAPLFPSRDPVKQDFHIDTHLAEAPEFTRRDSEEFGTQLFRVGKSFKSIAMGKFYPEDEGLPVELAKTVPYRSNTLFAFVNSKAAHGATLPPDASLRERYAYQFYVKPRDGDLKKLLLELPPEQRTNWASFIDGGAKTID